MPTEPFESTNGKVLGVHFEYMKKQLAEIKGAQQDLASQLRGYQEQNARTQASCEERLGRLDERVKTVEGQARTRDWFNTFLALLTSLAAAILGVKN